MVPQFLPWAAQVVGTQGGGGVLASVPAQRVWWSTPPTVQLMRRSTALPAAGLPLTRKWSAEVRTSGAAWAANGVSVPVPEMPPTLMVAPAHPTGKRAGSMLVRLTRVRVPSVRASPTDGKPARLGSSPAFLVRTARRMEPRHAPPEQLSFAVVALLSLHVAALLRFSQPTVG